MRKKILPLTGLFIAACFCVSAQQRQQPASDYPVRGICLSVPSPANIDSFLTFINTELPPRQINTIVLFVDYDYQFKSHPELATADALSKSDADKIVAACKAKNISIVPHINLLGHQSWANHPGKLLEVYPEFDETPWIKFPENYVWPNADSLYCKSYCPLHPGVHKVLFDVIDELCEVFNANAFHAGMDEVFYIGMDKCPRCGGKNKAELFAGEVNRIHDHLAEKNRIMYMWADRFLDGNATGVGGWEGSYNATYPAIDMVSKDIVMCDWHYERPDKTAPILAAKGFRVLTSVWNRPHVTIEQAKDMQKFYAESAPEMKTKFIGVLQTVWSSNSRFFNEFYNRTDTSTKERNLGKAFKVTFPVKGEELVLNPAKDFPIIAYVPCQTPDQISKIDFSSITHIHYAFVNPDSTGRFAYNPCLDSLVKIAHKNGVRVLASIGGGSAPEYYSNLLSDQNRSKFVTNLTNFTFDYKLDGIDVDLEGNRIDSNYDKLVSDLRGAMHPANKLLSAAIATVYKDRLSDYALKQFDYLTIMSYDKTGPWRPEVAGHHSPYSMAVEDLDYWGKTRNLDRKKLYLGVPFYGYSFGKNGASSMSYNEIVSTFKGSEKKDELKMPDGSRMYYNGLPTIRKKVKLAKKEGGGVMFWQLWGDTTGDKSLLRAINEEAYPDNKSITKKDK
jgi:hypothetical protein